MANLGEDLCWLDIGERLSEGLRAAGGGEVKVDRRGSLMEEGVEGGSLSSGMANVRCKM